MGYPNMKITLNKNKSIGKVLFIVEGGSTEPYILRKIFTSIFDYQLEEKLRERNYKKYNSKDNPNSQVFVINAEESNIKYIAKDNEFLNNLFIELIENYDFDIDNAAIFYLFDRDCHSNTDSEFIKSLLNELTNSRENNGYGKQGILLLSYPSIESFTFSNFEEGSFQNKLSLGSEVKSELNTRNYNHQRINDQTIIFATNELFSAFKHMKIDNYDIDNFGDCNMSIYEYQERIYSEEKLYHLLSLMCISLIDLGLIEVDD